MNIIIPVVVVIAAIFAPLAIWLGIVYAAIHFILKFW